MQSEGSELKDSVNGLKDQMEYVTKGIDAMLANKGRDKEVDHSGILGSGSHVNNNLATTNFGQQAQWKWGNQQNKSGYCSFKTPKTDFPKFEGDNVRSWVNKANRYFQINPIDEGQKVLFASLHLEGRAEIWFQSEFDSIEWVQWFEFTKALSDRYSEKGHENIIGEFNKLI
ncbi:hypothetical protein IFM89_007412 [Coptis chinensis]|uniref:Retrotransposon gag domain-containing protein n=1 Tax=Coptis chinensis TaxID=261450 RepID=A0A835M559_9MAGN|nr:hypothetical protein IFM89_007412 [Coptis chinensis]